MALILNIDTATNHASVGISNDDKMLAIKESAEQKEHASFVHVAINNLLAENDITPGMIDAVAITSGPGSYTGLRVGMAAAKGWCYATNKPLIAVNTLKVMAKAALQNLLHNENNVSLPLVCPMIDARRTEVFTAIYDKELNNILPPCSMVLEKGIFDRWLTRPIYFFGSGSENLKPMSGENMHFINCKHTAHHLGQLAFELFKEQQFSPIAYLEPEYLKDFYTINKPLNGSQSLTGLTS